MYIYVHTVLLKKTLLWYRLTLVFLHSPVQDVPQGGHTLDRLAPAALPPEAEPDHLLVAAQVGVVLLHAADVHLEREREKKRRGRRTDELEIWFFSPPYLVYTH